MNHIKMQNQRMPCYKYVHLHGSTYTQLPVSLVHLAKTNKVSHNSATRNLSR